MKLIDVLATKVHTAIEIYTLTNKWVLDDIFNCLGIIDIDYKVEVFIKNFIYDAYMDITYNKDDKESRILECSNSILKWLVRSGYIR